MYMKKGKEALKWIGSWIKFHKVISMCLMLYFVMDVIIAAFGVRVYAACLVAGVISFCIDVIVFWIWRFYVMVSGKYNSSSYGLSPTECAIHDLKRNK